MEKVIGLLEQVVAELKKVPAAGRVIKSTRFAVVHDNWILDRSTGLEWGPTSKEQMNLEQAAAYCADQGGRLPTVKELFSLVDHDKYDPAIDKEIFSDTKSNWYWTATPYKGDSSYAWCVGFYDGGVSNDREDDTNYVRPVRASQCALTV